MNKQLAKSPLELLPFKYKDMLGFKFLLSPDAYDEEPQAVIFLDGIWHIKEFGIEGQIPRIPSPVNPYDTEDVKTALL